MSNVELPISEGGDSSLLPGPSDKSTKNLLAEAVSPKQVETTDETEIAMPVRDLSCRSWFFDIVMKNRDIGL